MDQELANKNTFSKKMLIIIVSVLVLAIGLCLWFFVFSKDSKKSTSTTKSDSNQTSQPTTSTVAIDNNLPDTVPGNVRECYENALTRAVYEQIQKNVRLATEDELQKIRSCNTQLGYGNSTSSSSTASTSSGSSGPVEVCKKSNDYEYSYIGKIITQSSTGITSGVIGDSSALLLPDGKVRIYFGWTDGIKSATSTTRLASPYTDAKFELDSGTRISGRYGHPRILKVNDNSYKLYVRIDDKMHSFNSTDGLAFTDDGEIFSASTIGFNTLTGPGVVKTSSGYRLYVSNILTDEEMTRAEGRSDLFVKSLVSSNLSSWTIEDGVRLGKGSNIAGFIADDQGKYGQAEHPSAIVNSAGEVMVAFRGTNVTCFSTSTDGLAFTQPILISSETADGDNFAGGDPDIIELDSSTYLVTGTGGGNTPEGHIKMGILKKK